MVSEARSAGLGATAVLLAAVVATLSSAGPAPAAAPLGHEGRFYTDSEGRALILHGLNMVAKRPPYLPSKLGFGRDDARFLARNGFNTVRLGVIHKGLEPRPGVYDRGYLRALERTERVLAREGIFTLLDFHQDLYNERFSGEGEPDWAVQDDGLPALPDVGFPANYFAMPALSRAFDHFWANDAGPGGVGIQDRYALAWRRTARAFGDRDRVLGYDLINEPWPGTIWPTCASPIGCPAFDRGPLAGLTDRVLRQIRSVDRRHLVFYEPEVLFNFGAESSHPPTGDPSTAFSYHVYCLPDAFLTTVFPGGNPLGDLSCAALESLVLDNALRQSRETGDGLMLSEFGATNDLAVLRRIVASAAQRMLSWQEWHYCDCEDPTTSGPGVQSLVLDPARAPSGDNLKREKLRVLAEPYPQAVAGTPRRFGFDRATGLFELEFATRALGRRLAPGATTEIALPRLHYPRGYTVEAAGARVRSRPGARLLRLETCAGASAVDVAVRPGPGPGPGGCRR